MMDYVCFGEKIRQERKKKGFSMNQLASLIGVTPAFMSHLEHGRRAISLETLVSLCNALQLSPNILLQGVEIDQVTGEPLPPASWEPQPVAWTEESQTKNTELAEPVWPMSFAAIAPQETSHKPFLKDESVFSRKDVPWDAGLSLMEHTVSPTFELWATPYDAQPMWEIEEDLPCDDGEPSADRPFQGSICIRPDFSALTRPSADAAAAFSPALPHSGISESALDLFYLSPSQDLCDRPAEQDDGEEAENLPPDYDAILFEGEIPPMEDMDWHEEIDESDDSDESAIFPSDFWSEEELEEDRPLQRVTISLEDHFPPEQMELLSELMTPWLEPPFYFSEESPCDLLCLCGPWGCAYLPFDFTDADLRPMDPEWDEWTQEAEMEYLLDLLAPEDPAHEMEDEDLLPMMQRLTFRECDPEDDAFPPALDDTDFQDDLDEDDP